jgi:hypothetical protein
MMKRIVLQWIAGLLSATLALGCAGQQGGKQTYKDKDKPVPAVDTRP